MLIDQFLNTKIPQGSVAKFLRCNGIFNDQFIAQSLLSLQVKERWKSVNIWRSYGQEESVCILVLFLAMVLIICKWRVINIILQHLCSKRLSRNVKFIFITEPDYITDLLQPVAATSSRSSLRDASRGDYVVPRTNRKMADRAFSLLHRERGTNCRLNWKEQNRQLLFAEDWKRSFTIVHTAPNDTWYNDHVMRPRSYSRGRAIQKVMLMLIMLSYCYAF